MMAAVHHHFVVRGDGGAAPPCMVWKASIDLSRPLVPSEGNLDPFDGLVTCRLLQQTGESGSAAQFDWLQRGTSSPRAMPCILVCACTCRGGRYRAAARSGRL